MNLRYHLRPDNVRRNPIGGMSRTSVVLILTWMQLLVLFTSSFSISSSSYTSNPHKQSMMIRYTRIRRQEQQRSQLHVTQRSKFDYSIPPINVNEKKDMYPKTSTSIKKLIPNKAAAIHLKSDSLTNTESTTPSTSSSGIADWNKYLVPFGIVAILGLVKTTLSYLDITLDDIVNMVQVFLQDPQTVMNHCVETIQGMGPLGIVYFGIVYVIAEVLAIPAVPLTVSAGYLFGLPIGVSVVLLSATMAATISFFIGKTVLRSFVVTNILQQNPKFAKIDRIIGERGFSLLIVLRLSPLFPFALSNYVYGASSIDFVSYFWATLLGFAPGTIAYVYTGMVGKEIMFNTDGVNDQPWYVYGVGFALILGVMKVISDTASSILQSIDEDDENNDGP